MHCDEFEGARAEEPAGAQKAAREEPGAAEANPDTGCARGLCRTCAKRESCTFPKPEGGVWHCEEFE